MMKHRTRVRAGLCAALLLGAGIVAGTAPAESPEHGRGQAPPVYRAPPHQHFDARFSHNHAYPDRGWVVHDLPRDRIAVVRGPNRYFYSGGVWYVPRGPQFVVVAPPPGVFIPVLPPFYTTVWFSGVPYYYANDTYYIWNTQNSGYQVVDPPAEERATPPANPSPPPAGDRLYIYPKNGQSQEQQDRDQYECHTWAVGQTGFDPTAAGGNVPPRQNGAKRTDYNRAWTACILARGYSVQ